MKLSRLSKTALIGLVIGTIGATAGEFDNAPNGYGGIILGEPLSAKIQFNEANILINAWQLGKENKNIIAISEKFELGGVEMTALGIETNGQYIVTKLQMTYLWDKGGKQENYTNCVNTMNKVSDDFHNWYGTRYDFVQNPKPEGLRYASTGTSINSKTNNKMVMVCEASNGGANSSTELIIKFIGAETTAPKEVKEDKVMESLNNPTDTTMDDI